MLCGLVLSAKLTCVRCLLPFVNWLMSELAREV